MNEFGGNEFTTMALYKSRHNELMAQADNERTARSLREEVEYRLRRAVRINNNSHR